MGSGKKKKKCKSIIQHAKSDVVEQVAKSIKTNNKQSAKPAKEPKRLLKEDGEMIEQLKEFFAFLFTVGSMSHVPMPQPLL